MADSAIERECANKIICHFVKAREDNLMAEQQHEPDAESSLRPSSSLSEALPTVPEDVVWVVVEDGPLPADTPPAYPTEEARAFGEPQPALAFFYQWYDLPAWRLDRMHELPTELYLSSAPD